MTDSFMAPEKKSKGLSSFLGMLLASGVGLGKADAHIGFFSLLLMMLCVIIDEMKKKMG
jgi:hypothetical protein